MKYAILGLLILSGCTLPVSEFGTADEHVYDGKSWYIADRRGQVQVASMTVGSSDPADEYRAAARDYLRSLGRVCSVGTARPGGDERYVFDYSCR
ncbi:MAG: hypothetical protein FJX25_10210 [Alphaproteobacteria bacterium]|nr:hypothetical protein [Alphaproteobacteria bacterium]